MLNFGKRYPNAVTLRLQTNYRSVSSILDLANRSIEFNRNRLPKTLRAHRSGGDAPVSVLLATPEHQAAFVCQRILELHHEEAVPLRRMAVLYRAHSNSLELQLELNRRQIPYSVRSGLRFFEQAHIKDVIAYLRVMHNPLDELAAGRVIQMQTGLGRTAMAALGESFGSRTATPHTLAEHLRSAPELTRLGGRLGKPLGQLASLLDTLSGHLEKGGVRQAIEHLVKGPYAAYARRRYPNADERLEDLTQLAQYTDRYADVEEMLSDLALTAGVATESISPGEPPEEDRLALSTVHQAKGLEWRVVFVIWLCEGRFPSVLSLKEPRGEEEERRLFHVAATRAQDLLYMVRPAVAESERDFHRVQRPSRFLSELLPDPPFETWDIEVEYDQDPQSEPKT
jgi:DNA helicase-2/ATP-dependent DNA helicase PcrA